MAYSRPSSLHTVVLCVQPRQPRPVMLVLPVALLLLGALLPPAHATAPSFTNGHMSPRNRQPGGEQEAAPVRGRPARLGTAAAPQQTRVVNALPQQEVAAVVEETTPWAEYDEDQFEGEQVTEVGADAVEEFTTMEPKTHAQLIAEELQRREEELQSRAEEETRRVEEQSRRDALVRLHATLAEEEQGRRDAELKLRAEEQLRRDEELKRREEELQRRADADLLVQQELERRAAAEVLVQQELEARKKAAAILAAASDPLPEDVLLAEPSPEHEEEFFRPQSGGRGGARRSRFHVDETRPEDTRNKRHEEIQPNNQTQTTDDIELRKQEEARKHTENLSRKEEIEIKHLESGLAHEAAGTDQHRQEAYEHDRINIERDLMINQQEIERQRLEQEREKKEEIRKFQEMERLQREQEEIIQEQNLKRQMNMDVHNQPRSDARDGEAPNGSSAAASSGWALLVLVVLGNIRSYFV